MSGSEIHPALTIPQSQSIQFHFTKPPNHIQSTKPIHESTWPCPVLCRGWSGRVDPDASIQGACCPRPSSPCLDGKQVLHGSCGASSRQHGPCTCISLVPWSCTAAYPAPKVGHVQPCEGFRIVQCTSGAAHFGLARQFFL